MYRAILAPHSKALSYKFIYWLSFQPAWLTIILRMKVCRCQLRYLVECQREYFQTISMLFLKRWSLLACDYSIFNFTANDLVPGLVKTIIFKLKNEFILIRTLVFRHRLNRYNWSVTVRLVTDCKVTAESIPNLVPKTKSSSFRVNRTIVGKSDLNN